MFKASEVLNKGFLDQPRKKIWQDLVDNYAVDESAYLRELMPLAKPTAGERQEIEDIAVDLIRRVRAEDDSVHMVDALLQEYSLDTEEGVLLMCLAEALMRIPDKHTADALIRDKMSGADWKRHMGRSGSVLVNASTWGLLLTGKVVKVDTDIDGRPASVWKRLVSRAGEPVIRAAMYKAMGIMGRQFVLGRTIGEALDNGRRYREEGYTYSFDMLGEAAMTQSDAERYFSAYRNAIDAVSKDEFKGKGPAMGVSIKLSALHPRYERAQEKRVHRELVQTVLDLVRFARERKVALTIDAEEMDRLEISLEIFETVFTDPACRGWGNFGMVIQAYSKRALPALCWLTQLGQENNCEIPVRLVKGAYWDTEIKHCQQLGLAGYPVFTRKEATDTSYLACLRFLMSEQSRGGIYPQLASHNAHTVASVIYMAKQSKRHFEFQRLHGMGDALYNGILKHHNVPVRIYAPVGAHKDLLPYLVRRLLENGANSSFVHRLVDAATPVEDLVQHPVATLEKHKTLANPLIPLPKDIFGPSRKNSKGVSLAVLTDFNSLNIELRKFDTTVWTAAPIINGEFRKEGEALTVRSPHNLSQQVGQAHWASAEQARLALDTADRGFKCWNETAAEKRAQCLERFADLMERHLAELMAICCREAGKTLQDGIDEVREAVDFCRFYANQAREKFAKATPLPGPTGESNELYLEGRGVFLCISPWNFPLAIFTGQVMAALAAGNSVVAKPAEQTSLIATRAVELMLEAGFPPSAIQLLPGDGVTIGEVVIPDERCVGVAFTGSSATAHIIHRQLASRKGIIPQLIAETGGQNAMIVDSTALPEQVIQDVVQSAFASAGQRCSALRVLYLQRDVADRMEEVLAGAMAELHVGDPAHHSTDVGPVIDAEALELLEAHTEELRSRFRLIAKAPMPADASRGHFIAPVAYEIDRMGDLKQENFGPVLHVVRYDAEKLDDVIEEINQAGFGLTLGIHSRSEYTAEYIERRVKVGNTYVNRNQIGAVVGVQPFGGRGLSGTGPKAGGPNYIVRFATERTRTINTTAVGGNATLLSLGVEKVEA
jgi:RHH-type proline utilization regulon transcriptional repressor/proline dehydrogenase/delta 1-pyrroline-5-carboxylate dehydrogenase